MMTQAEFGNLKARIYNDIEYENLEFVLDKYANAKDISIGRNVNGRVFVEFKSDSMMLDKIFRDYFYDEFLDLYDKGLITEEEQDELCDNRSTFFYITYLANGYYNVIF